MGVVILENTVERLMKIGFSKTEALVYITLLKIGQANGYRLSKELGLSKSTIYQVLDTMYKNGYILMIPNNSKEYEAKDPELLFEDIEKKFHQNSCSLKEDLSKVKKNVKKDYFYRIQGKENIEKILIGIIEEAEKEIYINTDFNLIGIKEPLKRAIDRGIRVIAFCFNELDNMGLNMEIYHKSNMKEKYENSSRIMVVVDLNKSLVVTRIGEIVEGIFTDNQVFVNIIAEHIHSDIYMAKIAGIYEKTFDEQVKIDTLHEKRNRIK